MDKRSQIDRLYFLNILIGWQDDDKKDDYGVWKGCGDDECELLPGLVTVYQRVLYRSL